jgi:hypothetical protein
LQPLLEMPMLLFADMHSLSSMCMSPSKPTITAPPQLAGAKVANLGHAALVGDAAVYGIFQLDVSVDVPLRRQQVYNLLDQASTRVH